MKYILYLILIIIAIVLIKENIEIIILLGIVSLIVYFIFFNKKKDKEIEYDLNDEFLELYDLLGFVENYEKNIQYPYLKEIIEHEYYKVYRFFLNRNRIDNFLKGVDLIEQELQEKVIDIRKDEDSYKIVNIRTTDNKLQKFISFAVKNIISGSKLIIGYGYLGIEYFDLDKHYHVFVCGEIGGGKSVCIKSMSIQIIHKTILNDDEEVIIKIADFKGGLDYSKYKKHVEIVTDINRLLEITNELIHEMKRRERVIEESGHDNFQTYNKHEKDKLKRYVLIIDEIVEALELDGLDKKEDAHEIKVIKKIVKNLSTLARLCRALGINLIFGTQLPTSKCIVNQIKNNIPIRVCYKFADKSASSVVLGSSIASNLPDIKGRMIYKIGSEFKELQTPFLNNEMIETYFEQYGEQVKIIDLENKQISNNNTIDFNNYKNKLDEKEMDHKEESKNLENEKLKTAKESEEMKNNIKGLFEDLK